MENVQSAQSQGDVCQTEVCPPGFRAETDTEIESFIKMRMNNCKKHYPKKHEDVFIPIKELRMHHLPPLARDPDVLKFISDIAQRTVRLVIRYTSTERPAKFGCGQAAGTSRVRYGTGALGLLLDAENKLRSGFSDGLTFKIFTAAHVVFDDKEAEKTTVEFFVDDDSDRSGVVMAQGLKVDTVHVEGDFCSFLCQVDNKHDGDKVMDRFRAESFILLLPSTENLVFCVSHPHGAAQRVSFGKGMTLEGAKSDLLYDYLKLLVHKCHFTAGVDVKKVLFFVCDNQMVKWFFHEMSESEAQPHKAALLEHLVSKGLICPPTQVDHSVILLFDIELMEEVAQRKTFTTQSSQMSQDEEVSIEKEIFHHLASEVTAPDGLELQMKAIIDVMLTKEMEIRNGSGNRYYISYTGCLKYSAPTCPGSSGSTVSAVIKTDEGLVLTSGIHSHGGRLADSRTGTIAVSSRTNLFKEAPASLAVLAEVQEAILRPPQMFEGLSAMLMRSCLYICMCVYICNLCWLCVNRDLRLDEILPVPVICYLFYIKLLK